jgi:hypothetical protein
MKQHAFKLIIGKLIRVEDLNNQEFLQLDPEGGVIRFVEQRALLLDAVAMGSISLKTSVLQLLGRS